MHPLAGHASIGCDVLYFCYNKEEMKETGLRRLVRFWDGYAGDCLLVWLGRLLHLRSHVPNLFKCRRKLALHLVVMKSNLRLPRN